MVFNPHDSTQQTFKYLQQSLIDPTSQVNQEIPCWNNYEEEFGVKAGKYEDQVGTSVTVKVGEINENIKGGVNNKDKERSG